jgi:hypothetical protein
MAYTALFAFGDSLSDAGNDWIVDGHTDPVSPYYQGHFSNGRTWVEIFPICSASDAKAKPRGRQ